MKTKLFTKNAGFAILIALVMAFSMQGHPADALTFGTSRSGDLQTVDTGDDFTIRFSVNLRSPQAANPNTRRASTADIEYADGTRTRTTTPNPLTRNYTETVDSNYVPGDTHYYTVTTTSANHGGTTFTLTTNTRSWVTESAAYYYNDESVSITSTPAVTLQKGRTDVTSLTETASESDERLTSSVTLKGEHNTAGAVNITITDTTPTTDFPSDAQPPTTRASVVFTVYVVGDAATTAATDVHLAATSGGTTPLGYQVRGNQDSQIYVTVTGGSDLPVTITVNGGGRVYVEASSDRQTSATTSLRTSSAAPVVLSMNSRTNKVTVNIQGVGSHTATYIYGNPSLEKIRGTDQMGLAGGRLNTALGVRLTDFGGTAISGLPVTFDEQGGVFIPVPDQTLYKAADADDIRTATSTSPGDSDNSIIVYTDSTGAAYVYYQFASADTGTIPVTASVANTRATTTFRPEVENTSRRPTLEIVSGNNQRTDEDGVVEDPLVVVVRRNGNRLPGHAVTFVARKGILTGGSTSGKRVTVTSDNQGEAEVQYDQDPGSGSDTVTVSITSDGITPAPPISYEREVVFGINGGQGTLAPTPPTPPTTATNTITISLSSNTGEPGDEIDVSVSSDPSGRSVTINSGELDDDDFSRLSGITPFASTLLLPGEEGEYDFSASGTGLALDSATVTVEAALGTLSITAIGSPEAGTQAFSISARDSADNRPSAAFTATLSGQGFATRSVEIANGIGNARVTLPTAAGLYTLTVRATGYTDGSTPVRITGETEAGQPTPTPTPAPTPTVSEPVSIKIVGPSTRSGTVNEALEAALIVQVLDAAGEGVEGARVFFRVPPREGRLSQRGNGSAIAAHTDSDGYARASDFTPLIAGTIPVEVEVRGITEKVAFTITTGLAPATETPGTGETPTPSTTVSPVLNPGVGAASRPPMLWVSGGKIYVLVGAEVKEFISNVENAMNLAVGGGKVYWTAQTSEKYGTLNSANLDGTDAKQLRTVWGVPRGITLDPTGSKLYWVDAANRLQRSDLDGSDIENVIRGLSDPKHVALSRGNAYWIGNGSGTDTLSFINLSDPKKEINPIAATSGTYGGLAIAGGKLYWTEKTSDTHGTLHSVNLDGTGAKELRDEPIWGAPIGIAVDTARSRLYWTDAVGRLQRSNLDGSRIQNVAKGLGRLGDIVLSNSIMEPAATTPTTTPTTASKYDVNGDGSVDSKDIDVLIVAILAELTDDKYDVNDDGNVDVSDVKAVNANLDAGAAGAPTLLGTKLSAVQIDRLQEQIDLLVASNDRSPTALKTLIYLQQLLATARPEKTQLLVNYPNPFNPETWIPYELATDTDVRITIYNAQGVVIRTLQLGQQSAGYYTDRERAAYWDGRNALGEQVASGIYFYQLETDEMSTLRKMVILK